MPAAISGWSISSGIEFSAPTEVRTAGDLNALSGAPRRNDAGIDVLKETGEAGEQVVSPIAMSPPGSLRSREQQCNGTRWNPPVVAADVYATAPHVGRGCWTGIDTVSVWRGRQAVATLAESLRYPSSDIAFLP
jgi:hypothetical protein